MLNVDVAAAINAEALCAEDPLLSKLELPLQATLFPLGFPLILSTNSPSVMEAAETSWGKFRQKFSHPPLEFRIGVTTDSDNPDLPPVPTGRMHWGLLTSIADANNYICVDLMAGRSFGWITQTTAECHSYLRYYLLDAAVLLMVSGTRAAFLHAACVCPFGHGMLLCGDSGAGKSTLAYAGAKASGWTLICDDGSHLPLDRDDLLIVGDCNQIRLRSSAVKLFPEIEGLPVTPRATGKPSVEISTSELQFVTADSAVVEYLVFLNRNWTGDPELAPLPKQSISPWLARPFIITAAGSPTTEEDVLRRLFDVPIYELRYTDLDWAIERLNTLALTGR